MTRIAFEAKRTWNYPDEYFQIWKDELTINETYIKENLVLVALINELIVGFVSIVHLQEDKQFGQVKVSTGYWMNHLFVDPDFHHKKIGRRLVDKTMSDCERQGINSVKIFVDPYAKGFYEKMGVVLFGKFAFVNKRPVNTYLYLECLTFA